jgi:isoquinoline 1-oxidoreductase alpha subunit
MAMTTSNSIKVKAWRPRAGKRGRLRCESIVLSILNSQIRNVNGKAERACMTPLSTIEGKTVVSIEGLSPNSSHPLQKAWVAEEVPQCGYCQSGQIMKAAELLAKNPKPSRADIITHMDGNICRCGTYHRIIAAIERASKEA